MNSKAHYLIRNIILGLAVLGCADTLYLLSTKYQCIACETIHNSVWGRPMGIPIALFGLCAYLTLMILMLKGKEWLAYILVTSALLISIILVYVQFAILKSFCVFCIFSGTLMLFTWFLLTAISEKRQYLRALLPAGLIVLLIFVVYNPPVKNLLQTFSFQTTLNSEKFSMDNKNVPAVNPDIKKEIDNSITSKTKT